MIEIYIDALENEDALPKWVDYFKKISIITILGVELSCLDTNSKGNHTMDKIHYTTEHRKGQHLYQNNIHLSLPEILIDNMQNREAPEISVHRN